MPKIKELEKGFFAKYIIATLCLVLIFAISISHSKYMNQKITDISKIYLSKISVQNANIVSSQIHSNLQTLDVLARMMGNLEAFNVVEIMKIVNNESGSSKFINMGVVLKDGSVAFTPINEGKKDGSSMILASDWGYIEKVMEGNIGAFGSSTRKIEGETVSIYATPIYQNTQIKGVLVAYYNDEFFQNLILPQTFDRDGSSYIADQNGTIIFHPGKQEKENRFCGVIETLSRGWALGGASGELLKSDIEERKSGTIEYRKDKEDLYISYVPMHFHDWYLISITATSMAEAQSQSIYDDILPSFIYILIILMTLTLYFIYMRNQSYKRLESRMKLQSVDDESYRMIMEQTNDIIFEYDTLDKTYLHTANFQKTFGYQPTRVGFMGSLESDYIHPDDVTHFVQMYEKMKKEKLIAQSEVRMINSEGEYLWTKIYMLGVFDRDGMLVRVIGKIVNIDKKKKEMDHLKELAIMDSATRVYNKQTTEDMIETFLKGEGKHGLHALLIIDIDDFKGINDDHGHRLGDMVISELGLELNKIFRASDIKGRIGGDEFMILMKDIEGRELIVNKAKTICEVFTNREIEPDKKVNISTSIGIAIYDQDGSTYEELYEAADRALYSCKNIQKGTFSFCSPEEIEKSGSC